MVPSEQTPTFWLRYEPHCHSKPSGAQIVNFGSLLAPFGVGERPARPRCGSKTYRSRVELRPIEKQLMKIGSILSQFSQDLPRSEKNLNQKKNTKIEILKAAKTIFSEKGYKGTTVRDIAAKTGFNIGLISYHFGSKESLYRSILIDLGEKHKEVAHLLELPPDSIESCRDQLREFINYIYDIYVNDLEGLVILSREIDNLSSIFNEVIPSTFLVVADVMTRFFQKAQDLKLIDQWITPRLVAHMVMAQILHFCRFDKIRETYGQVSIKDRPLRDQLVEYQLRLYLNQPQPSQSG